MKKIIALPIIILNILLFPFLMYAQKNYQDVVYLKNGNVIHGMIIEQVPDKSIKIQAADKKIVAFTLDEIEKITREIKPRKQSGFMNRTELELGGSAKAILEGGLRTINGYQINKNWSIGIGLALNAQSLQSNLAPSLSFSTLTWPIFLDLKYDIRRNNHSFYFYLDGGYSILLEPVNGTSGQYGSGGNYTISLSNEFMADCGVGYSIFISPKTEWTISISLNTSGVHELDTRNNYDYGGILYSDNLSKDVADYFALRTGFIF